VHVDKHILDELVTIGVLAGPIAFHHLAFQVDANENVIRIRDIGDVLGEPGNLKCMINLRPTKD
ncbi:MAG: hypothetical protein KGH64_00710, partial [Candidatus Micrarchaeota archaeon]|nr:hypothetical protein [Candidatus Micrarchaeota archaeon]